MDLRKLAALGLVAVALAPSTARAQEKLAFDTIVSSAFGGADKAEQRTIWDVNEYRAFFHGTPPSTPVVKWGEEVVIALSLGARPTSGHSIEVTRILHGVGLGLSHHAFVEYVERAPKPTDVVLSVVTQPLHVVKMRSSSLWSFVFTHDASLARGFDEISLTVHDGTARSYLTVDRAGQAVATVRDAAGKVSSNFGPVNSIERYWLDNGFAEQDLLGLPDSVSGSTAQSSVVLTVRSGTKTKTFRAPLGLYKDAQVDVTERVKYLVESLRETSSRIAVAKSARLNVRGRLSAMFYTEDSLSMILEGGLQGGLEIRGRFLTLLRRASKEGRLGFGALVGRGRTMSPYDLTNMFVENSGTIELDWAEGRFAGQAVRVVGDSTDGRWTYVEVASVRVVVPSQLVTLAH